MEGELRAEGGRGTGCIGAETEEEWRQRMISRERSNEFQDWSSPQEHLGRKEEETSAPSHPSPLPALCTRSPQFFPAVPLLTPLFSIQVNVRTLSSNLVYTPTQALASPPSPAQENKQTKLTNRPITPPGPQNAPHLLQRQRVQKAYPAQSHTVQSRQGTHAFPCSLPPPFPKKTPNPNCTPFTT